MYPSNEQRYIVQHISTNDSFNEARQLQEEIRSAHKATKRLDDQKRFLLLAKLNSIDPARLRAVLGPDYLANLQTLLNQLPTTAESPEEAKMALIHEHEHIELPEEPEERIAPPKPGIVNIGPGNLPRGGKRPHPAGPKLAIDQAPGQTHTLLWASVVGVCIIGIGVIFSLQSTGVEPETNSERTTEARSDSVMSKDTGSSEIAPQPSGNELAPNVAATSPPTVERPGTIAVIITPLRTSFGAPYGAEARDEASGTLLAKAEQVAMEGNVLEVDELQYSPAGNVIYRGKLFFDAGGDLVRQEQIEGYKRWHIFETWNLGSGF